VALVLGFRTREFALLLLLFNLSAAAIGHPYWSIAGDATARWASSSIFGRTSGSPAVPSSSLREARDP